MSVCVIRGGEGFVGSTLSSQGWISKTHQGDQMMNGMLCSGYLIEIALIDGFEVGFGFDVVYGDID